MPKATWNRILEEFSLAQLQDQHAPPQPGQPGKADRYRRLKIAAVEQVTKRPLIIYASACTSPGKAVPPELLMIDFSDKIGFKTVTDNIDAPNLDVLVHSPGGVAEAAESIVHQLRAKFTNVRFIIPTFAKSAATMLVMSGNEILMDRDAELGPIDPQMRTQNGFSPAEAIWEQFKKAQDELKEDPSKIQSWLPILAPLGPSLLIDAQHAIDLSKEMVKQWTRDYMFANDADAMTKSAAVSTYLSNHSAFKSHARAVKVPDLLSIGVKVTDIRSNPALHKAVDELYCSIDVLLVNTPVYKLFENSVDDALIRQSPVPVQPQFIFQGPQLPLPLSLPPVQPPPDRDPGD